MFSQYNQKWQDLLNTQEFKGSDPEDKVKLIRDFIIPFIEDL